jgi:pantoate--beta-alanine ligase
MTLDLDVPVEIVGVETVREPDGLAMSSRNVHLAADQRSVAPRLYRALRCAAERIAEGSRDAAGIRRHALATLECPEIRVEYLEIVDAESMQPVETVEQPVRIAAAVWIGSTRLIDNVLCVPRDPVR